LLWSPLVDSSTEEFEGGRMDRTRNHTGLASAGSPPEKAEKHQRQTAPAGPDQEFMKEEAAAALLNLSIRTLQGYRHKGGGPRYHKFGRSVRYARADLLAWARSNRRRSTSDSGA
jgi:hypothetical protein